MKKSILIYSIFLVLIVGIIICGVSNKNEKNNKTKIITSFYPMYITTINLTYGIDEIDVQNLTTKEKTLWQKEMGHRL